MVFQKYNVHQADSNNLNINSRTIYYGEVISIEDESDGGRIKVRISVFDTNISDNELPWSYPLLPKFFHVYPQVGEVVRIFIEDVKFPHKARFWLGSLISQPQKIGFDSIYSAYSTTNIPILKPEPAPSTYPDAEGVFPLKNDVAIVGKINTDIILRNNEVHLRAGKHDNDNIYILNKKNPSQISLVFERDKNDEFRSSTVVLSDKIALISHDGKPKFKSANLTIKDRDRIFDEGHPIARGDVLIEALNIIRNAIINHIHGYSGLPADKVALENLEKINFDAILQKNIVIN